MRQSRIRRIVVIYLAACAVVASGIAAPATRAQETSDYVHYRLGVKYKNEGKDDQAVEEFRKVLAAYPDNYNAYMHIAEIREKQGRPRLAIYNLQKALAYNPGWAKAYMALARAYEADAQYEKAMEQLQLYMSVCDPDEQDSVQTLLDNLSAKLGRVPSSVVKKPQKQQDDAQEQAVKKGVKPMVIGPEAEREFKHGVAAYQEAVNTGDAGGFDKALEYFRSTLKYHPGHPGAYYYAGLIRRRKGENAKAKVNFTKAIPYPELGYNAHFYLGKIYGEEGSYAEAITHLKAYVGKTDYEAGKREAQSLIERYESALISERGDTVKVDIAAVGKAEMHREISEVPPEVKYAPMEVRIDSLLSMAIVDTLSDPGQAMLAGVRAFAADDFDKAIEMFKRVLVSYPRGNVAARSIYNIGICYIKTRDFRSAENQFQQVIERYPSHEVAAKSMFLKALCYFERHELDLAERLFRRFIQNNRTHQWVGKAYEKLGDCYVDLGQDRKAVDAYTQAVAQGTGPADKVYASFKLGEAYFKIDNPKRALESFEQAIAVGEKNGLRERVADSYYKIADYYYKQKDYDRALDYYVRVTRAHEWYHDTPWGLFQIGNVHKNRKNYSDAIQVYKKLIDTYPGNYWASQAKWKLEDTVWENEYRAVLR